MSERIVIGHVTPLREYSPLEQQRRAPTLARKTVAERFTPVSPEPQWRPYEPCKEGAMRLVDQVIVASLIKDARRRRRRWNRMWGEIGEQFFADEYDSLKAGTRRQRRLGDQALLIIGKEWPAVVLFGRVMRKRHGVSS